MRWHQIINERGEAFLYHATPSPDDAAAIIAQDILLPKTSHPSLELGMPNTNPDGYSFEKGVSLTRSGAFADQWRSSGNEHRSVVFVLDWMKLRQRYKVRPFDYYQQHKRPNRDVKARSEAEEFCITNSGITPLDRYLVEVRIAKSLYDFCVNLDTEDYGATDHPDAMYGPLIHCPKLKII